MACKIPVSVIVVTKNEAASLARCLGALTEFDEVIVVDSGSEDYTCEIAREHGADVISYVWDGRYPKKRQWCLDSLELVHDWVFFVDADEVVTPDVVQETRDLFACGEINEAGFFVKAHYIWNGKMLRFGLQNQKLVLLQRSCIEFPVIDDLDYEGMGEIEGHYQPVLKEGFEDRPIGNLQAAMLHYAYDDMDAWQARHLRYAQWESRMMIDQKWPEDPIRFRRFLKYVFRAMPMRSVAAFLHSYILKFGFLDGAAGFDFARSRMRYYVMISDALKANKAEEKLS